MKKITVSILSLCLCAALFTGCEFVVDDSSSTESISSELSDWTEITDSNISEASENATSKDEPESKSSPVSSKQKTSSVKSSSSKPTTSKSASSKSTATAPESSKPVQQPEETKIEVISVTSPIGRNETAALTVKGKPNTEYDISVFYSSGASEASGLENKTSDANGKVTWEWKIGGRTNPGTYRITVTGGGQTLETEFTVA